MFPTLALMLLSIRLPIVLPPSLIGWRETLSGRQILLLSISSLTFSFGAVKLESVVKSKSLSVLTEEFYKARKRYQNPAHPEVIAVMTQIIRLNGKIDVFGRVSV